MESENQDTARLKKHGTREEVYKGLALRTAGGLKRDDIIPKQFGSRIIYISKRLSDRMKVNFNIIRASNPNHFKKQIKKTLGVNQLETKLISTDKIDRIDKTINDYKKKQNSKTMKLAFKVNENIQKNIYYKELKGININELKEELKKEEAEEDLGILQPNNTQREFNIETMPDIDISLLE